MKRFVLNLHQRNGRSKRIAGSKGQESGFSLIEVVVSIVILSILSLSIMFFAVPVTNLWKHQTFEQGPATEARLAMMRMAREINQTRNRSSVSTAQTSAFNFTDANDDAISYGISAGVVQRTAGGSAKTLAQDISSLQFIYYDKDGNQLASPSLSPTNIRRIEIVITVTTNGLSKTFRTQVRPQNLYFG
jgi:prepilin-type N-terminal cleavage/methylation domain-containing protein